MSDAKTNAFHEKAIEILTRLTKELAGEEMGISVYCLHYLAAHTVGSKDNDAEYRAYLVRAAEIGGTYGYPAGVLLSRKDEAVN